MALLEEVKVNKQSMNIARCGSCKFAFATNPLDLKAFLECRYNPPTLIVSPVGPNQIKTLAFFPPVERKQFCGKFEPRNLN